MKLWQKNYLAVLSVSFALLFSVCAALLVKQNDHAFQAEKQRVEGAFAIARQAVAGAAALYTDGEAALSAMNRALSERNRHSSICRSGERLFSGSSSR